MQYQISALSIDKMIPVEQPVKFKMQDSLDFLQWTKRFWDQYIPGGDNDAAGRCNGSGMCNGSGIPAQRWWCC